MGNRGVVIFRGLVVLFLFLCLSSPVLAVGSPDPPEEQPIPIGAEAVDRRTAFSRHIYLGDGKYQAEIYSEPIHALDAREEWQPIENQPTGSIEVGFPSMDTFISQYFPDPQGGANQLWVGYDAPAFSISRTIMTRGGYSDLPPYSIIDDGSSDVVIKLYQFNNSFNPSTEWIAIHEMTNAWAEDQADWTNRYTPLTWNTSGGDFVEGILNELARTEVSPTLGYYNWHHFRLRDIIALWRTYLTNPIVGQFGKVPYGLLFKLVDESHSTIKQFCSKEWTGTSQDPKILINYVDGPIALADSTPAYRRVPSPDFYSIPGTVFWQVVALRVENAATTNYDLDLYNDSGFSTLKARSNEPAGEVDLIVMDGFAGSSLRYPLVYSQNGGVGYYRLEYQQRIAYLTSSLAPMNSYGPYTMETDDVVHIFTFSSSGGSEPCLQIDPMSGNGRLGAAVFGPESPHIFHRDQAVAQVVSNTGGASIKLCFRTRTSGVHALVIWGDYVTLDTPYTIDVVDYEVNLPLVIK